jgi:predicted metalloprotease with PDZ domain
MRALDEELRRKSNNDVSLDTVVRNLLESSRTVTNAGFRAAAEALVGKPLEALSDCP